MDLEKLYNLAEKEHINIYNCSIAEINGIYLDYENYNAIGLNYKKLNTITKEKCTLAEELGHYYYDSYYSLNSDKTFIDRQEYRALKWKSLACIPLKSFITCFYKRDI